MTDEVLDHALNAIDQLIYAIDHLRVFPRPLAFSAGIAMAQEELHAARRAIAAEKAIDHA